MRTPPEELEYIEEFIREYRAGHKEFVEPKSQSDRDLIAETLLAMETYESEKKYHQRTAQSPLLTIEQASEYVKKNWLGRKDYSKISGMLQADYMRRKGYDEEIAAHGLKVCLDAARARHLICDSKDITRKFKECTEKQTATEKKLQVAQQRIMELENLVKLLGGDPTPKGDTFRSDVGEGGDSHE